MTPLNSEPLPSVADNMTPPPDLARAEQRLALALWKADQNQPAAARLLFQEALQLNPANVAFWMAYIEFLLRQAEWSAAKEALARAIDTDPVTATAWLNDKLQHRPTDPALLYLQALLLMRLSRQSEAQAAFGRLLQMMPGHGQAWVDQAAMLETVGQRETAERSYRAALEIEPNNVSWRVAYSTFLEKGERDEEAWRVLEYILALVPGDVDLQARVERLKQQANRDVEARKRAALAELKLKEQDDVVEAAALIAEALQMAPACALAHRVQADIFRRQGHLAQAEAHLARAVELEPDNADHQAAWQAFQMQVEAQREHVRQLVAQARAAADRETACLRLDEALKLIADDVDAHVAYAEWLAPDWPDEAEQHLKMALTVAPRHLEATKRYVMLLGQQGRWLEAEPYFQTLKGILLPQDEELTDAYAGWLIEQGRYQEVIDLLAGWPVSAHLQGRLAVALAQLGRLAEAQEKFKTALQVEPHNATLHGEYAEALRQVERWTEAETHFRTALELEPAYVVAWCGYADLLLTRERYHEALQHIQQAQILRPDDVQIEAKAKLIEERLRQFEAVEAELAYAVWLSNEGRVIEARRAFDEALTSAPESVIVLKKYALFLEHQEELDQARMKLEKILQLMPGDQEIEDHYAAILTDSAVLQPTLPSSSDMDTPILSPGPIIIPKPDITSPPPELPVQPSSPEPSSPGFIKNIIRLLFGRAK